MLCQALDIKLNLQTLRILFLEYFLLKKIGDKKIFEQFCFFLKKYSFWLCDEPTISKFLLKNFK
jgi:hypothetical protein